MRIGAGIGTEPIGTPAPAASLAERAATAEGMGFPSAWCVHFSRGVDSLSALLSAGMRTRTIELGVGVVPVYPRHPVALAQQAATVQTLVGGRLTLGVGVSHRPVIEGMHGIPYAKPAAYLREYLSVLRPMLHEGKAAFDGEFFQVDAEFTIPGTTAPVPVLVGGLSAKMVRVAGELGDGVVTWLAGRRTLDNQIVPGIQAAAREAGRPPPRIVAALPVAVCEDVPTAREAANVTFARYGGMPNYQRQFQRENITAPGEIAVVGDEQAVEAELRGYAAIGVTEFWPVVFPVGEDASDTRTWNLLAALAPDLR